MRRVRPDGSCAVDGVDSRNPTGSMESESGPNPGASPSSGAVDPVMESVCMQSASVILSKCLRVYHETKGIALWGYVLVTPYTSYPCQNPLIVNL